MEITRYIILFLILLSSSLIGRLISKKYVDRVIELEEMKSSLNIIKNKIKFVYQPIPEILQELEKESKSDISNIFRETIKNIQEFEGEEFNNLEEAWEKAVEETKLNLNDEDKRIIKIMAKMLGQTDIDGQVSQIEITEELLEKQIDDAIEIRNKNQKLYTRLGTILGIALIILLW